MKNLILIVIGFILIITSVIILIPEVDSVSESSKSYDTIIELKNNIVSNNTKTEEATEVVELPPVIKAWIRIDDTNIDYPIVQGCDNAYYQNHDYKGNANAYGALFIDYRNSVDFTDDYTLVYGHNSLYNLMFSDLKKLIKKPDSDVYMSFKYNNFEEHLYEICAISVVDETCPIYDLCDLQTMQDIMKDNAVYYKSCDSNLILLTTCYGRRGTDKRLVVAIKSTN